MEKLVGQPYPLLQEEREPKAMNNAITAIMDFKEAFFILKN